jgi:hypothetical protein
MDRQELIDEAIKVTKDTITFCDDWTALDKLMAFVPTERLKEFLPVGEQDQTIEQVEAELEATRKKISETKYLSFGMSALLVTEQKLEQALADAHTDAEMVVMIEDIAYAFLENKGNLTNYWKTYNLNEREQRELEKYLEANKENDRCR